MTETTAPVECTMTKAPPCEAGHRHEWTAPLALVGGCDQNPGVHANGPGVVIRTVCQHCGTHRRLVGARYTYGLPAVANRAMHARIAREVAP